MTPIEILKIELEKTTLSAPDQAEFLAFLSRMRGQYLIDIIEMAREDSGFLTFLWSNYNKKTKAFAANSKTLTDEIVQEEREYLDKINQES